MPAAASVPALVNMQDGAFSGSGRGKGADEQDGTWSTLATN